MPSLELARRISAAKTNGAKTLGQIHKENADWSMEYTWDTDIQSKTCYIYDYYHDDQPRLKDHMTYENTTKTKIDAKVYRVCVFAPFTNISPGVIDIHGISSSGANFFFSFTVSVTGVAVSGVVLVTEVVATGVVLVIVFLVVVAI